MADPEAPVSPKKETDGETDEELSQEIVQDGDQETTQELASQVMKNPQVLAAIQERLGSMVGESSGYIESLPEVVKRRVKALKKLQFVANKIEGQFYDEVHQLECKYVHRYSSVFEKRRDIISGDLEPTDSDCDWPSDVEDEADTKEDEEGDAKAKLKITDEVSEQETKEETAEPPVGIPNFWLTTFKNVDILNDMIQEHDEPILLHLRDITLNLSQADPIGFSIEFHFDDNDFFTNRVLTKKYHLRTQPEMTDSLMYEGPEIVGCEGCNIDWKPSKNVTMKTIKKKQKHKGRGTTRTINKTVQVDSFFNFFNPPKLPDAGEGELDDETDALLAADYEIGHIIRERVIPRAVLYFTGEALDDDDYDEEAGDEEDDDEDDEADPDFDPGKEKGNNEQCKQQ